MRHTLTILFVAASALCAQLEPRTAQVFFREGVVAVEAQRLEVAEQAFRKALALQPGFTAARKNLGTVLWFLNRHGESEAEFRSVVKANPQDPVPHLYLGLAGFERQAFVAALQHFISAGELAMNNPETRATVVQTCLGAAEQYDRQKRPEQALAAYQQALKLDADSTAAYLGLAAFASAHGNNAYALKMLRTALERTPRSAPLLLEQGLVQAHEGLLAEAEASFRESAQADPDAPVAQLALGVVQIQRGQASEAETTLRSASIKWAGNGRAQYLYALAIERTGDRTKRPTQVEALRTAIRVNSKDSAAHALLGRILLDTGPQDQAIRELETALKLDPINETALYQLARTYRTLGRVVESQRLFEQLRKVKAQANAQESELVQLLKTVQPDR